MRRAVAGFTLIEMMVVIVLIGVMASMVLLAAWSAAKTAKASENQGACRCGCMFI